MEKGKGWKPSPTRSAVEGLPGGLLRAGYHHSAAPSGSRRSIGRRIWTLIDLAETVSAEADETGYGAADVVLAVEVVSPESEGRDRERKPQLYAEAGIPHFWLVEKGTGRRPVVHVYELDKVTDSYVPTGIHHDRLKLTVPFDIDIDLTEIDQL